MVNAIHLTMSSKDQIATWKANRRKLVSKTLSRPPISHSSGFGASRTLLSKRDPFILLFV